MPVNSNMNLLKGTNLFFDFSKSAHPQSTERKEGGGQRVTEKTATSGRLSEETFLPPVYTIRYKMTFAWETGAKIYMSGKPVYNVHPNLYQTN